MPFPPRASFLLGLALLVGILGAPNGSARAQSNGDGSIYSRFGIGTLQHFSSSRSQALGGGGYALRSLNYNPMANPALWSDQVYTRLAVGGSYKTVRATTASGLSSQLDAGTIDAVQFSFPLYKRKLGVGLSFQPFSQHNYRTRRGGAIALQELPPGNNNPPEEYAYDLSFQGKGGLHSVRGGLGYRVNDALRVGAGVDVIFGILERQRTTDFEEGAPAQDVQVTDATRLAGVSGTVGGHLTLADFFKRGDNVSLGAAVALPATLNGTRVLTRTETDAVSPDTLTGPAGQSTFEGKVTLPWRGRFGVAYQPNAQWTITADGLYEPWSTFSSSFAAQAPFTQRLPVGGEQTLTDRWRVSVGAEVVPAGDDPYTRFLRSVAYRLGAYTERFYVRPDGETALHTYAITGGVSLPTALSGTRIDLNLRAGTRGRTEDGFVQDRFYGISLHVNFGEEWFQERRLR